MAIEVLFTFTALLGLAYFGLARRRFDCFSLGFLSALAYFLPGFVGYSLKPRVLLDANRQAYPLSAESYLVFVGVIFAIILGALVHEFLSSEARSTRLTWEAPPAIGPLLALACVLGFSLLVYEVPVSLWRTPKVDLIPELGREYVLFSTAAILGAVVATSRRQWLSASICGGGVVACLGMGFRMPLAIVGISLGSLWLSRRRPHALFLQNVRFALLAAVVVAFMLGFAKLRAPLRAGDWERTLAKLLSSETYSQALLESEPFLTQALLNRAVELQWREAAGSLPVPAASGRRADSMGEVMFADARGGVASSFWGELLWRGGPWGLAIGLGLLMWLWAVLSQALLARSETIASLGAVVASLWCFYLHRNSLPFQANLTRRFLVLWLIVVVFALVLQGLQPLRGPRREETG